MITPARIGPAHGAYTRPSPPPTTRPDQKPSAEPTLTRPVKRVASASSRAAKGGTSSSRPKPISTTMASVRSRPFGSPSAEMTYTSATVANVKLSARPATTPSGRPRPPVAPAERATGSTGSTHGDTAVAAPATSANAIRTIIARSAWQRCLQRLLRRYPLRRRRFAARSRRSDSLAHPNSTTKGPSQIGADTYQWPRCARTGVMCSPPRGARVQGS